MTFVLDTFSSLLKLQVGQEAEDSYQVVIRSVNTSSVP